MRKANKTSCSQFGTILYKIFSFLLSFNNETTEKQKKLNVIMTGTSLPIVLCELIIDYDHEEKNNNSSSNYRYKNYNADRTAELYELEYLRDRHCVDYTSTKYGMFSEHNQRLREIDERIFQLRCNLGDNSE
ncbi:MAG: hypothetical protein JSR33_07660 [Proteobacteria bacterium]|nr:hypothetical protein [Pseudomonadota bacterium]